MSPRALYRLRVAMGVATAAMSLGAILTAVLVAVRILQNPVTATMLAAWLHPLMLLVFGLYCIRTSRDFFDPASAGLEPGN